MSAHGSEPDETNSPISDEMLLAGFGVADPEASLAFVRRFQSVVFGVAIAVVGDRGVAEDVAQQAFERAWRHADRYDPCRGTVRGWLATIARNLAVDFIRTRRARPTELPDLERLIGAVTDTPEDHAMAGEDSVALRAALAELPVSQARAVVLSAVYGMTAPEVAELEQIPVTTAKSRIRAALTKLHTRALEGDEQ